MTAVLAAMAAMQPNSMVDPGEGAQHNSQSLRSTATSALHWKRVKSSAGSVLTEVGAALLGLDREVAGARQARRAFLKHRNSADGSRLHQDQVNDGTAAQPCAVNAGTGAEPCGVNAGTNT